MKVRASRRSKTGPPPIAARTGPLAPAIPRRTLLMSAALLLLLAVLLYGNSLANPYISDDVKIIAENAGLRHPTLGVLATIWTSDYWVLIDAAGRRAPYGTDRNLYRPFTVTTYLLNDVPVGWLPRVLGTGDSSDRIGELRRICYRFVNILLHAAAAFLIGWWCASRMGRLAGAAAALTVVVHPVATDVINRLVGRADILVLLGVGGCLLVQHIGNTRGWTWRRALGAASFAGVALFSKEAGLIVLLLVVTQHWLDTAKRGGRRPSRRGVLMVTAMGVLYLAARLAVVQSPAYVPDPARDLLDNPAIGRPWILRLPAFFALCWHYARNLLYPSPLLAFDVPSRLPDWTDWQVYAGLCLATGALYAGAWLIRRRQWLAITVLWLGVNLLVVGQLLMPIGLYTEVRVMYTMTGALALAAAWAGRDLAARSPRVRRAALAVGGGVLIAAGWTDIRRNVDYRSEIELFTADLRARPSSAAAALRLGNSYVEAGDFGEAEHFLRLATTLAPASSEVWYDLGTFFGRERKDYRAALACFERSTAANPRNLLALLNGSVAALALGDLDYAWRLLTSAQQLQPGNSHVEYNMALVEAARGDNREALTRLQALSRNDPGDENVRSTLKRLLAVMQD